MATVRDVEWSSANEFRSKEQVVAACLEGTGRGLRRPQRRKFSSLVGPRSNLLALLDLTDPEAAALLRLRPDVMLAPDQQAVLGRFIDGRLIPFLMAAAELTDAAHAHLVADGRWTAAWTRPSARDTTLQRAILAMIAADAVGPHQFGPGWPGQDIVEAVVALVLADEATQARSAVERIVVSDNQARDIAAALNSLYPRLQGLSHTDQRDIVSEVGFAMARRLADGRHIESITAFAGKVAREARIDLIRKWSRQPLTVDVDDPATPQPVVRLEAAADSLSAIAGARADLVRGLGLLTSDPAVAAGGDPTVTSMELAVAVIDAAMAEARSASIEVVDAGIVSTVLTDVLLGTSEGRLLLFELLPAVSGRIAQGRRTAIILAAQRSLQAALRRAWADVDPSGR